MWLSGIGNYLPWIEEFKIVVSGKASAWVFASQSSCFLEKNCLSGIFFLTNGVQRE